jgi:hypothetical protein
LGLAGVLAVLGMRRYHALVAQCGEAWPGCAWQRAIRSFALFGLAGALMVGAMLLFVLHLNIVAVMLVAGCALTYALGWRMELQLNETLSEWASLRFLRTMVSENSVVLGIITVFVVLLFGFSFLPGNSLNFPPANVGEISFSILLMLAGLLLGLPLWALYTRRLRSYQRLLAGTTQSQSQYQSQSQSQSDMSTKTDQRKTPLFFSLIWFAIGLANGIRGDWLGLALSFILGTGFLLSRDADLNNWRELRRSPRQLLGLAMAAIALALFIAQIGFEFGRSLRP